MDIRKVIRENLMKEWGEATAEPFEYTTKQLTTAMGDYEISEFVTEANQNYSVTITRNLNKMFFSENAVANCSIIDDEFNTFYNKLIAVAFFIRDEGYSSEDVLTNHQGYNDNKVVNKFETTKIMSTIVKIMRESISPEDKYIFIGGGGENQRGTEVREKMYLYFMSKSGFNYVVEDIKVDYLNKSYKLIKLT